MADLRSQKVIFNELATLSLTLNLDCRARKWNRLNLFVGGCVQGSYDDCTATGDEVVIMMMLSMVMTCISLSFYVWPIVVRCIGVGLVWVGFGRVSYLVGWVVPGSIKWTHGQFCSRGRCCAAQYAAWQRLLKVLQQHQTQDIEHCYCVTDHGFHQCNNLIFASRFFSSPSEQKYYINMPRPNNQLIRQQKQHAITVTAKYHKLTEKMFLSLCQRLDNCTTVFIITVLLRR